MSAAFKHVGVDRNTVVVNAPITELYIAAPDKYKELLKKHSSQIQLSAFATQCAGVIKEDPAVEDTIKAFNASAAFAHGHDCLLELTHSRTRVCALTSLLTA
ncbi:hypothetical protein E1301_Tti021736 [Triplophysa tibetana]|uniref:Uncharacterized protein n=1 Tax=Triplophysa tibetana TaxID=1572043 RepID=A0A5A9PID0_9TELE|nr:hypothetical protein E1301_Tti021736 [Triplophysa tibetana]